MKKRRTVNRLAICILLMALMLNGCGVKTSKSYTFSVETGDKVEISLNTGNGYDLSSNLPFTISKDENVLSQGIFISSAKYEEYVEAVKNDPDAKILDSGIKNGIEYVFWDYDNSEFNYAVLIKNSKTGIILGNNISKDSAEECFNRLKISKK